MGTYLSYSDSDLNLDYLFDVTAFAINNESLFKGIIYEKLDRIYIYESIDMYDNSNLQSNNTKLIGSLSTQQIIQNGSDLFPNRLIAINLDLDVGEVSSRYGSANCGGPSYYRISESGFEFIVETTDAESTLYNVAADKIHISSHYSKISKIYTYGAHSQSFSAFTVTEDKLLSILNNDEIDSTESETLMVSISLSFIAAIGFIMLVRRQKYKKNKIDQIFMVLLYKPISPSNDTTWLYNLKSIVII